MPMNSLRLNKNKILLTKQCSHAKPRNNRKARQPNNPAVQTVCEFAFVRFAA